MAETLMRTDNDLQNGNRELNEIQMQLIQNEKMASFGRLVAGVVHEIANPLAFVTNNLFVAERGVGELIGDIEPLVSGEFLKKLPKLQTCLEEMLEGLNRVNELAFDYETFSRIEEGGFKTVDVVATIDSVLLLLKFRMNNHIKVEKHFGRERMLHCSCGRLNQDFSQPDLERRRCNYR